MSPSPRSKCRPYRQGIDDLIDGVDSVESRERLSIHAEGCAPCAADLARATELRRLIDSAEEPEISAASEALFIESVMAGMDDSQPLRLVPRTRTLAGLRVASALAAAATAVFLLRPSGDPAPAVTALEVSAREVSALGISEQGTSEPTAPAEPLAHSTAGAPAARSEAPKVATELALERAAETKTASLEFDAGEASGSMDRDGFQGLLDAASESCSFDPHSDLDSAPWIAALAVAAKAEGNSHGTVLRGARELLRGDAASPSAPLAARILGKRADLRDRRLLTSTLDRTGTAGAIALCERGSIGVHLLWKAAAATGEDAMAHEVQRAIEQALVRWNADGPATLTDDLDLSLNVPLATTLLAQSGTGAAKRLLGQYLEHGDARWRDAWLNAPLSEEALEDALRRRGQSTTGLHADRMLMAIEHSAFAPGLGFTVEALSAGNAAAAHALAALPGQEPLVALMGLGRAGRLQPKCEDLAWGLFADRRSEAVVAFASRAGVDAADRAKFTLTRLALVVDAEPAARRSLLELGLCAELLTEHRVRALLLAFEGHAQSFDSSAVPELVPALRSLTEAHESELAAAAWIALWHLDRETVLLESPLSSTLARHGSLAVQHLRVVREVRRARASESRSL